MSEEVKMGEGNKGHDAVPPVGKKTRGQDKSCDALSAMYTQMVTVELAMAKVIKKLDRMEQYVEELDGKMEGQLKKF